MDYIFLSILTFLFVAMICLTAFNIRLNKKKTCQPIRQSDNHLFLKSFFSRNTKSNDKPSQLKIRKQKTKVNIIFTKENKAYWVDNNIFYVANVIDGNPDFNNAEKVDTTNMSKKELDKMLTILDNLDRGDTDERGSSGD